MAIKGLDSYLTSAPEQPDCVDSCALAGDLYGKIEALRTELALYKKEFGAHTMSCVACSMYGEVRPDCPNCHGFNIESAVPLMESNEELFKRQDADLATLQAAYDTAAEENHHAYHAVIPGLQAELAAARERIAKLEFIMNEGKRLVTTRTTKAGVDYFRELCRKHEAGEV